MKEKKNKMTIKHITYFRLCIYIYLYVYKKIYSFKEIYLRCNFVELTWIHSWSCHVECVWHHTELFYFRWSIYIHIRIPLQSTHIPVLSCNPTTNILYFKYSISSQSFIADAEKIEVKSGKKSEEIFISFS